MQLPNLRGTIKTDYNLSHLTWFKVGGAATIFYKPFDIEDLAIFLSYYHEKLPITVIGAGSNIIVRDGGIAGIVIRLGNSFTSMEITEDGNLQIGAGALNANVAKFCLANSIAGLEFLVGIPGTIGGGVTMNAGAYGKEFADILLSIEAMDYKGNIIKIRRDDMSLAYRKNYSAKNLIVTKAIFKGYKGKQEDIAALIEQINKARSLTQPIKERTGGSTFMNPKAHKAWKLIDEAGLRGHRVGDASISELHCNFMINHGQSSASELERLGNIVQESVFSKTGIQLEWEIKRIGISLNNS